MKKSWWMRLVSGLFLTAVALTAVACGHREQPAASVPTTDTDTPVTVTATAAAPTAAAPTAGPHILAVWDTAYLPAALELIAGARERIAIVHFEFVYGAATRELQNALAAAVQRGVAVTMLLDEESAKTVSSIPFLTKLGIAAQLDQTRTRTHTKLMVADGRLVLFGSTNFSTSSMKRNHETNLRVDDLVLGTAAEQYITALRQNAEASIELPPVVMDGLTVYFDRAFEDPLLALLAGARQHIEVQMYGTRYYPRDPHSPSTAALAALAAAARRGVKVRVMLEHGEGSGEKTEELNRESAAYLAAAGVAVRFDPRDIISHAKLVIVDDRATVGSMNWGYGGFRQYHEMNSILTAARPVADLQGYFATLWEAGEPYTP